MTMNHTAHPVEREEVMAYLDGQLKAEHVAIVEAHLAECAECKTLETDLRRVSEQAQAWQVEAAPARLKEEVEKVIPLTRPNTPGFGVFDHRPTWMLGWRWKFAAGLAAVVLVGVVYVADIVFSPAAQIAPYMADASRDKSVVLPAPAASSAPPARQQQEAQARFGGSGGGGERVSPGDKQHVPGEGVGLMVIQTASLVIVTKEFENARAAMEAILRKHGGHFASLESSDTPGNRRSVNATMRVPTAKLDAVIAELKQLGRVENESVHGEEVTQQYVDLTARLTNARNTEKRLTQVLENRTGKVKDVLEVEREIARVREEIEQMDAQRKNLENRMEFATVQLRLLEEYEAQINPPQPSAWLLVRNAGVEGFRSVRESAMGLLLFVLSYGPPMLFWAAVFFWPARFAWRKMRAAASA